MVNYYRVLGLNPKATQVEIIQAYYSDLQKDSFVVDKALIHTAYAHLGTRLARKRYHRYLRNQVSRVDHGSVFRPPQARTRQPARVGPAPVARMRRSPPPPVPAPLPRTTRVDASKTASPIGRPTKPQNAQRLSKDKLTASAAALRHYRERAEERSRGSLNRNAMANSTNVSQQPRAKPAKGSDTVSVHDQDEEEKKRAKEHDQEDNDSSGGKKDYGKRTTFSDTMRDITSSSR
ncbi:MAG: hypothetical protein Q9222_001322 [Ikaeria aurantiellina]